MNKLLIMQETDFHSAWSRMVHNVLQYGTSITIGSEREQKPIREVTATIELTGNAIKQIENHEIHPQFPFKFIKQYVEEFTYEYQKEYEKDPTKQFVYTYFDRLTSYNIMTGPRYGVYDQLKELRRCLETQVTSGISSNRCQAITWRVRDDNMSDSPPCLQRIWLHHVGNKVDIHLDWRSRDLFTAWQVNLIAIIQMLNTYVVRPNDCEIGRIIESVDSLHIYDSDRVMAEATKITQVNPMMRR